jgi:membrane protein YdbS with pleckstrin-like domain
MANINENFFKIENEMQANKVEDILDKGEKVLLRTKPVKKAYIWSAILTMFPFALLWAAIDSIFVVVLFSGKIEAPKWVYILMAVFLIFHMTPVWIWLGNIIRSAIEYKNIEYVFTEKRIIVRSGIIGIDFKSVYYSEVEGVNLRVGLFDKIFKVGDVYIQSMKQSTVLYDISNPYFILSRLQKITLDIKTDINYPNDLRPETNHGYNTKYIEVEEKKK